jgi:hypothetical protein
MIPSIAESALIKGETSPAILQLAVCKPSDKEEIIKLFRKFLVENGAGAMSKQDALRHYAKQISDLILSDKLTAYDGAKLIWRASINVRLNGFHDVDPFIYAASEMEERPNDRDFFVKAIRDEARRWSSSDCLSK